VTIETCEITTADGRTLSVEIAGSGERAIIAHGGTPSSRRLYRPWVQDAADRGVRLISYDRPGYGGSTRHEGRTVAGAAADTRTIATALGLDRIAVWGFSGGGPHAIACAVLLPDIVSAVAVLGSPAPLHAPGLDYFAGMGEANVESMQRYLDDPERSRQESRDEREAVLSMSAEELSEAWGSLISPVDRAALEGELAEFLTASIRTGLAPGDEGWWDDGVAHLGDWGLALDAIEVPVKVWHGEQDRFVPVAHGRWLAANIGAESEFASNEGHLSLIARGIPAVHEWLLNHSQ
jgi:pimeloyl-ACP methyl ester carboxylesterase